MKQKIYFRADASTQIGYGHFIRTLALANMLTDEFDCTFFTAAPTEYQKVEVANVCPLVELPSDNRKFELFLDNLKGEEIIFLDNYYFTPEYEKKIKIKGCKLVVLSPSKPHHYADIVINYIDKDLSHYSIEPYTKVVAGLEWSILREPFRRVCDSTKRKKGNVVISFGGTDQYSLTEKVVDSIGVSKYHLSVICTNSVSIERRRALSNKGVKVYTDITAEIVAELFEQAEYAILSSSSVCLEALSRGAKVIAGYYVDNQANFYHALIKEHYIIGLGDLLVQNSFSFLEKKMKGTTSIGSFPIDFTRQKERYISLFKSICK